MKYRLATSDDLDELANLRYAFIQEGSSDIALSQSEFRDVFKDWSQKYPHCFHFISEENGDIISMVSLLIIDPLPRPIQNNPAWGYLTNTYTIPTQRNKGIASELFQFVKNWVEQKGLETVIVWPSDESISFYERAGFRSDNHILELKSE